MPETNAEGNLPAPLVEMTGITKRFGPTLALDQVDLSIYPGKVLAVAGENGSGKSTLMKVLAGVHRQDGGSMRIDGAEYSPKGPGDALVRGISMIHQELAICGHMTAAENIVLGREPISRGLVNSAQARAVAREALGPLGLGDLPLDVPTSHFSIGVRQLTEIARAIASDSRLVILDEPTSSLTEADVRHLFSVIHSLRAQGKAVVYISHFLNEIREVCDDIVVLRDGRNAAASAVSAISDTEIVTAMVGRKIEDLYPRSERSPGEVLLDVSGLTGRRMPIGARLELRKGEVIGIAGLNGSGRSELLRTVFGLDPVRSGQVKVGSVPLGGSPFTSWQSGVGFLSENRKEEGLAVELSITENLVMPKRPRVFIADREEGVQAKHWIEQLGIRCRDEKQRVSALSGGNQQKVAIARMLYAGVDVLLLDEPTRGIDVGSKAQIYGLIDQLAQQGKGIIMVSSYLPELLGVCDRIGVMHKGELRRVLSVKEWGQESLMEEAVGI